MTTSNDRESSGRDSTLDLAAQSSPGVRWQRHGAIPLVPRALWKHFAGALLVSLLGGGVISGAVGLFREVPGLPAGFERLFSPETGTLHRAFPGMLLFLAGQTALLIRWYRSRSLHDYNGRYRLWSKVAAAWFLMSAVVMTDAHLAWSDACRQLFPYRIWQAGTWVWLAPVTLVALIGWLPLYREMQGSRWSIGCYLISGALYLVAASLRLQCVSLATPETNWVTLHGVTWLAHVLLLLSMTLHARYVIWFTIEPVENRSSRGMRRDGGRLDWLKPTWWFRRALVEDLDADETTEGAAKKGRGRRKPARTRTDGRLGAAKAETDSGDQRQSNGDEPKVVNVPEQEQKPQGFVPPAKGTPFPPLTPRVEVPVNQVPQARPMAPAKSPLAQMTASNTAKVSIPRPASPVPTSAAPATSPASSQWAAAETEESGDDDLSNTGSSDSRGLSKKQRRKLMREMRDREQQTRR